MIQTQALANTWQLWIKSGEKRASQIQFFVTGFLSPVCSRMRDLMLSNRFLWGLITTVKLSTQWDISFLGRSFFSFWSSVACSDSCCFLPNPESVTYQTSHHAPRYSFSQSRHEENLSIHLSEACLLHEIYLLSEVRESLVIIVLLKPQVINTTRKRSWHSMIVKCKRTSLDVINSVHSPIDHLNVTAPLFPIVSFQAMICDKTWFIKNSSDHQKYLRSNSSGGHRSPGRRRPSQYWLITHSLPSWWHSPFFSFVNNNQGTVGERQLT